MSIVLKTPFTIKLGLSEKMCHISDDKDSSKVIMNKKDYNRKTDDMINEGRQQRKYRETDDNILKELE